MPKLSSADRATAAAADLAHALRNPTPATPFATIGDTQMQAIKELTKIFDSHAQQTQRQIPSSVAPVHTRVATPHQPHS